MKKINLYTFLLKNEKGLTLIELLASLTIFVVILIPLSSVYVSGISSFNKIQIQTSLRNEADFIIGEVINKLNKGSYFEVYPFNDSRVSKEELLSTLRQINMIHGGNNDDFEQAITVYKKHVDEEGNRLERRVYHFDPNFLPPNQDLYNLFSYSSSYLAYGLFRLPDKETIEAKDNEKILFYLILAPKKQNQSYIQNDEKTSFASFKEIKDEISRLKSQNPISQDNVMLNYIYIVRTELSVNTLSRG